MKEFKYVITDPEGIHARPAGILVKQDSGRCRRRYSSCRTGDILQGEFINQVR